MTILFDGKYLTDYKAVVERLTKSLVDSGLISDTGTGSVAQILTETFAREMATFYAILEKAHEAGYLNTASGKALDNVVAILGVRRAKPELLRGRVVFSRGTPAEKDIVIPAGARVTGPPMDDGDPLPIMETVEQARILRGGRSVGVAVQEISDEEQSDVPHLSPNTLTIMPTPLLGVEQVSNPEPVVRGGQSESDAHLRTRAGAVLREGQKGTVQSIEAAVRSMGIQTVKVVENPDGRIGCIEVRVGDPALETDLERRDMVVEAVRKSKAAGIHLKVEFVRSVYCKVMIEVEPEDADMEEEDEAFEKLAEKLIMAVTNFINGLGPGTTVRREKLNAVLLESKAVRKADLTLQTFIKEHPEIRDEDHGEPPNKEDTDDRVLPGGDWNIRPLENATMDPDDPVAVYLKPALRARMDLDVTVRKTTLDVDTVRQNVRAAATDYVKRIKPERDGEETKCRITFKGLYSALKNNAQVTKLQPTKVIHLAKAEVVDLKDQEDRDYVLLAEGEELEVARIDVSIEKEEDS